jgi:hypothetical protein
MTAQWRLLLFCSTLAPTDICCFDDQRRAAADLITRDEARRSLGQHRENPRIPAGDGVPLENEPHN